MVLGLPVCFPTADKKEGTALVGAHALTMTHKGAHTGGVAVLVTHEPRAKWG